LERLFNQTKEPKRRREHEQNFALLQQPEVEEMFTALDASVENYQAAKRWQSQVEAWVKNLAEVAKVPDCALPESVQSSWEGVGGPNLLAETGAASAAFEAMANKLAAAGADVLRLMEEARNAALAELSAKLAGQTGIADPARKRTEMKKQLVLATEEAESYEQELAKLRMALDLRRGERTRF
jgi:hypothetical protein